jgi:hypothetical protein
MHRGCVEDQPQRLEKNLAFEIPEREKNQR